MSFNSDHKIYLFVLFGSALLFLAKGIYYSLLGSYIPLLVAFLILVGLWVAVRSNGKSAGSILRGWGGLLILWGCARLIIELLFNLTPSLTENHIREQFTLAGRALSLLSILAGIYVFRQSRTYKLTKAS